jgi:hypothetical protein
MRYLAVLRMGASLLERVAAATLAVYRNREIVPPQKIVRLEQKRIFCRTDSVTLYVAVYHHWKIETGFAVRFLYIVENHRNQ